MSTSSEEPRTPGRPFGRDYRSGAAVEPVPARVRQRVQRQVDELAQRRTDAGLRRRLNTAVQERWSLRHASRLDVVVKDNGLETMVVTGEILVTESSWQDRGVRTYVQRRGLAEAELGCVDLESRLVRLVSTVPTTTEHLEDTVGELRARGFAASLTHVAPLGPIVKPFSGVAVPTIGDFGSYGPYATGDGDGARVAVIDTGIDPTPRGDGWLTGIPRIAQDDPATHAVDINVDPLDADPLDGFLDFSAGHGTFVSGVIAQVAPTADISMYRALGTGGTGSEIDVACALVRAVRDGAQVVNLSLGTQTQFDQPSLAMAAALDVVGEIERERGEHALIVAAAGNFGDTTPTWPAAFRRVVSVGALTADLRPSAFSSHGWWVDCSAVGEGVLSTYVEGEQSPDFTEDPETFPADSFSRWSGTSFAAPQVAGAVARLMQDRGLSARQAYVELLATGRPMPDFGQTFEILPGV
ncbi:S8 family peptidase [Cellulomonas fengjieae]|uniref:S8/S53 family peptidase n=1 Tax=Cellulomonas fengjieae TaxID=2819978 RepID=A0ABS3SDZ9_9CELL|nr:S8/S53 family peptidase [Cellulomonas fengjieae]MBO3083539.1 S8/S53 family peptidase [Cellulomonas fengjieae]MBO3101710.1 S8/S53 family peptidase [Cellulomonas fengjieae]QVI65142.1 S8/S53 family peptidase [Cellulomonas fengjieae]